MSSFGVPAPKRRLQTALKRKRETAKHRGKAHPPKEMRRLG